MNSSPVAFPFKYHHAWSTVIIEIVNKIVESQAAACLAALWFRLIHLNLFGLFLVILLISGQFLLVLDIFFLIFYTIKLRWQRKLWHV